MVMNHYKMREDVVMYNLAGMGCSASVISVDLATDLLQMSTKKDPLALVLCMENLTQNLYTGTDRAMLVTNALFRMGGAAILLSRRSTSSKTKCKATYRLRNLVRVSLANDDEAYHAVYQDFDNDRDMKVGVRLLKVLPTVAARALAKNVTILGQQILPWHEKLRYGVALLLYNYEKYKLKRIKQSDCVAAEGIRPQKHV
uniref:3-ketoacyl-CoA synthase 17 n=1 Tax=Lygus hesperus TaxID=30085 RepID=A0A0A9WQR2_LYGHE